MSPSGKDAQLLKGLLARLAVTETLSAAELAKAQGAQLAILARHHATQSPHFKARLQAAALSPEQLNSQAGLAKLKPITRKNVQEAGAAFFAEAVPQGHLPLGNIKTSGSTGEPVSLRKTAVNRLFWAAFTIRDHEWNKRNYQGSLSAIRANLDKFVQTKDWGSPVSLLFPSGPGQGVPITTPIHEQAKLLENFDPHVLLVYPSNLEALCAHWEKHGLALSRLAHLKTIGETVSEGLRARARNITGRAIEDNYSSQEAGPIAIQCPHSGLYHIMAESLIVEILDDNDEPCPEGQSGRVVITDLHNMASPVIRYEIGDFAEPGGPCDCGRKHPTLRRILGRRRNLLTLPDGGQHWPLTGFHYFSDVVEVHQYQMIQHKIDEIELRVVTTDPLTTAQENGLRQITQKALGHPFQIHIHRSAERFPISNNGKFEEFISRII